MSKFLRDLLGAEEPLFTQGIRELEFLANKKNIDNKLAAEILEKTQGAIRSLGLDPFDTTDRELFHALDRRIAQHNKNLAKSLGTDDDAPAKEQTAKFAELASQTDIPKKCWAIKKSVAKDLLREMPPKNIMKHLRYRSLESMLKNEHFATLYTALRCSESDEWLTRYNELFEERVTPSDFEYRDIDIIVMDQKKWVDITDPFVKQKGHPVIHTKELGVVAIAPTVQPYIPGLSLTILPLLFHYMNEIRLYSAYFKLKSTASHFGKIITQTLNADTATGASLARFHIHWRVLQRYFGKLDEQPPEVFQPHIQPEDLHWQEAGEALYRISPELKFWQDMEYVARLGEDGLPVSLNMIDVSFTYSNEDGFKDRAFSRMRESLWNELFTRYIGEPTLNKQVLEQLDNNA